MKTAAEHIAAALAELEASRDDLNRQISVLQRTYSELTGQAAAPPPGPSGSSGRAPGRPVREIALEVASDGEVFSLSDVVEVARAEGNESQYASISSILSRMAKEGVLKAGPRRGTYQIVSDSQESEEVARPATDSDDLPESNSWETA